MPDPAPAPAAPVDLDRWKIILGVALPVVSLAVGTAAFFWYRHHQSSREKKKDMEDVGNMLDELRINQAEVAAMRQSLQTGIEQVKAMETKLTIHETNRSPNRASFDTSKNTSRPYTLCIAPSGSRPLLGTVPLGSLPHSALGLEHQRGTLDRSTTAISDDSGVSLEYKTYKPPSTIPEESTIGQTSPFDTPGSTASARIFVEGDGSPRNPEDRAALRAQAAAAQKHHNSTLLCPGGFSPLRADPSHPDLVPQPLAVIKRNSFRGTSSPTRSNLDQNIYQKSLRRWSSTSVTPSTMLERERVLVRTNIMVDAQDEAETEDANTTDSRERRAPSLDPAVSYSAYIRPSLLLEVQNGLANPLLTTPFLQGFPEPPPPVCIAERPDSGNSPNKSSSRKNVSFVPRPSKKSSQKTDYVTPPPRRPLPMVPASKIPVSTTRLPTDSAPATVPKVITKRNSSSSVHRRPKPQSSPSSKTGSVSRENKSTPQTDPQTSSALWHPVSPLPFPVSLHGPDRLPPSYASSQCLPHVATGATSITSGSDPGRLSPRKQMQALQCNSIGLGQERILNSISTTLRMVPEADKD